MTRSPRTAPGAAVALAAVLTTLCAAAQQVQPQDRVPPEAVFQRADANSDGKLSMEEAARVPGLSMRWEELDKNKDGVLSREEFLAGYRARP